MSVLWPMGLIVKDGPYPFAVPCGLFLALLADKVRDKTDRGVDEWP